MARRELTESESEESEAQEKSGSEEEEEDPENPRDGQEQKRQGISEYEKQRLSRIAENRARMEAMGLFKMASSLMGSSRDSSKHKGKRKVAEDDEDYRPNDDDGNDLEDDVDYDNDDDEFLGRKAPGSRKGKVKNNGSKSKKKVPALKNFSSSDFVEDDEELMKAIALSLQDSAGVSGMVHNEKKGNAEDTRRRNRKKAFSSRVQMTEDELVIHFYQFDEAGKGSITIRDLQKIAIGHDFTWTDEELADMIHCFDGDRDGKLNLDDFRKIVCRCKMLTGSDNS